MPTKLREGWELFLISHGLHHMASMYNRKGSNTYDVTSVNFTVVGTASILLP